MKREYFIAHRGKDNEWSIFRKDEELEVVQWLSGEMVWTKEKRYAKRFLHKQSVESALSIVKSQEGELKTEEEYIDEIIENSKNKEKQSWSEL